MKIHVVIDYPGIDPDSEEADNIVECLEMDLTEFGEDCGHIWYIDDATED